MFKPLATILLLLFCASAIVADDWPRWRGPKGNGIADEKGWLDQWPKEGPAIAWKSSVGIGFSSVVVSEGRLFTLGNKDDKDTVSCLDTASGKPVWSHSYDAPLGKNMFEGGPTSTPTVHDGKVYTLSRWGDLFCFEAASGKVRWSKNVAKETEMPLPGWGFAGSPLVHDNLLLLNIGKAGMAVEKDSGKIVWTSDKEESGYSSPVPFQRGGEWYGLFSSGTAFAAVNLKTGKELWQVRWITRYGVNAADPIVTGDLIFLSSGYSRGSTLLKMGTEAPTEVWRNRNMRNQMNSSVLIDGHLYGIDGDTGAPATLRCVELKTGEVRWTQEEIGSGALMAADGKLIVLTDQGELLIANATPQRFAPLAKAKVLAGKCWTTPVLANGRIYCRNATGDLVCVDVRAKK